LFQGLLFSLSFERLAGERNKLKKLKISPECEWVKDLTETWDDELEGFA